MDVQLIGFIGVLLLSLAWHEAAHAWVADRLGDPTARQLGRVTLNPLKHLDPILSVILPITMYLTVGYMFGGGKPVPINPAAFRHPRRDFMFVAVAGPLSNLLLAAVFALVFVIAVWTGVIAPIVIPDPFVEAGQRVFHPTLAFDKAESALAVVLGLGVLLNTLLAVFNLVPLPPLDGSRVVGWLLPHSLAVAWYRLDRIGIFLILGLFIYITRSTEAQVFFFERLLGPVYGAYVNAADSLAKLVPLS